MLCFCDFLSVFYHVEHYSTITTVRLPNVDAFPFSIPSVACWGQITCMQTVCLCFSRLCLCTLPLLYWPSSTYVQLLSSFKFVFLFDALLVGAAEMTL
jgi:hypothetical protein